ncbi:helix-turn-helix domain-containing protein [Microbacterium fluvii]|uniref:Helix-turn-helix domain-containing protein n=1 Tax=Microbacterium fluvii TaxID=415215 RepID=A0ABW2HEQ4_9MICO|nr:helix-turn-helix domain-containing protein [Microbacterium fluvii]MCU4673257.1 helix-turn-helix domain-containing protein [Microbacterium fluvii]
MSQISDSQTPDRRPAPAEPALDFTAYRHAVSDAVVSLDVHSGKVDGFAGALTASVTGDIHVLGISADQHSVHRTPGLIARAPQRYFKFSLIERGTGLIVQDGRETALGPGDMAIYDTDRPYSLLFDEAMHMSVVMFPKVLLDIPAETVGRLTATRLDGAGGVGAMIRPYLASLARDAADLDGHVARRLFRTAVDMVGTLLEANLGPAPAAGGHDTLMRRILDHIDEHLGDPELSPGQLAAAHFISVRHLHALFSEQGTTVSTVIRTRRLERCYDELVNPQHAHRSITAIALSNGFVEPAHFSRTFRAHFGVPPSAVRAEHA